MIESIVPARVDIRILLRALADGWQSYLPAVAELGPEDATTYLAAQGHDRVRDVLAYATALGEEALGAVPVLLRGDAVQRRDVSTFAAQAIARFSLFSSAEVERRFTQAYAALAQLLAFLPDTALARPEVYDWLYMVIVEQFNAQRPPNMLRVP